MIQSLLLTLIWNPNPTAFTLPYFDLEVRWYGLFFVVGFYIGYLMIEKKVRELVCSSFYPRDIRNFSCFEEELKALENTSQAKLLRDTFAKQKPKDNLQLFNLLSPLVESGQLDKAFLLKAFLLKAFPKTLFQPKELSNYFSDHLVWHLVIGTVVGARLGHVFFYEWPYYQNNLWAILNIREGGLASHGGTLGVLFAIYLFSLRTLKRFPEISILHLMDMLTTPIALVAFFIRLGNFFNQEIVGKASNAYWSVLFVQPAGGESAIPRHPAQLYEGLFYLFSFFILYLLPDRKMKPGAKSGLFFFLIFGSRFFIEYLKEPPTALVFSESTLLTGQLLSLPLLLVGLFLLLRKPKEMPSLIKKP